VYKIITLQTCWYTLLFTDQLGQRAFIHQFSLDVVPDSFQEVAPPNFAQSTEEALNASRRYRTAIYNADWPAHYASLSKSMHGQDTLYILLLQILQVLTASQIKDCNSECQVIAKREKQSPGKNSGAQLVIEPKTS